MDPEVCYLEMIGAVQEADRQLALARERAVALWDWLSRGGDSPRDVPPEQVRIVISQVLMRTEEADHE